MAGVKQPEQRLRGGALSQGLNCEVEGQMEVDG